MRSRSSRAGPLLLAVACTWAALSPALAEEEKDLVFNYTRLELDAGASVRDQAIGNWLGEGWIGTDYDRAWWKSKGSTIGSSLDSGDAQLLYSRYIARFWDGQIGYRRSFKPYRADQAVLSLQGLAPYWFETDLELFFGGPGDVSGRFRAEYQLLWTQRLISNPELTLDWGAGSDRGPRVGSGIQRAELELQTRYEITRKFAPYVSVRYERALGQTAQLVRGAGESPEAIIFSLGVRLIF